MPQLFHYTVVLYNINSLRVVVLQFYMGRTRARGSAPVCEHRCQLHDLQSQPRPRCRHREPVPVLSLPFHCATSELWCLTAAVFFSKHHRDVLVHETTETDALGHTTLKRTMRVLDGDTQLQRLEISGEVLVFCG